MSWQPPSENDGPYKVLLYKNELIDHTRSKRAVPFKAYYPHCESIDNVPVILWSHGLGGSRDGAAFLARFIASHGYVVINVQHLGSDTSIWEGKPGHPWDVIRATHISRQTSLNRFYDIPFMLDQLPSLAEEKPELAIMDLDKIGMSGHSFGAMTTQIMAGQLFPDEQDNLCSISENRFTAGILYSFVPMGHVTKEPPEKVFSPMKMPLLFMSGTEDENPLTAQDYTYRLPVYDHAGSNEKYLLTLIDGDHMVYAGSRGKLEENSKREEHENIIKITSLAFWDAQLKDDKNARTWLTGEGIRTYLKDQANYEYQVK